MAISRFRVQRGTHEISVDINYYTCECDEDLTVPTIFRDPGSRIPLVPNILAAPRKRTPRKSCHFAED